jgi:hypothetical protein
VEGNTLATIASVVAGIDHREVVLMSIVEFLASATGRAVRVIAGIVLIVVGLLVIQGTGGILLAIVGLVPLLAGLVDVCIIAPVFGHPLSGKAIRAK